MEFRRVYIEDEPTQYEISDTGILKNSITQKKLKGSLHGNYRVFSLRHKNKTYTYKAHRLVAQYFLANPDNLPVVHHIDGNPLNNNVENLQWVTQAENLLSRQPKLKKKNEVVSDDNDFWKQFRDSCYYVSQQGKVKNIRTNKLLKGAIDSYGYIYFHLRDTINKNCYLHRMVWEVFGGNLVDGLVINHKDANKLNNRIENLEQVTPKYNRVHALENVQGLTQPVYQYDKTGTFIAQYASINECARQLNLNNRHLSNCLNDEKITYKGYLFCKSPQHLKEKMKLLEESNRGLIGQYDYNGQLINTYNTIQEIVDSGIGTYSNLQNALNGKYKTAYGYKWKRIYMFND